MMFKLLFLLITFSSLSMGHQTGLSYLQLTELESRNIKGVYKKPLEDSLVEDIKIKFPSSCNKIIQKEKEFDNGYSVNRFTLYCTGGSLVGSRIWVEGLVLSDKGIIVNYKSKEVKQQNLLTATKPFMLLEQTQSLWQVSMEYIQLGFFHILNGYDHLLFVLALLFLSANFKTLFYTISAFTFSHSITLGLTILGFIELPILYVEAMIALSIMILYREIIIEDKSTSSRRYLPLMALLFGLLHGLGFATVLNTIGLDQEQIMLPLLTFNLGIELGQVLFIVLAMLILTFIEKLLSVKKALLQRTISYLMGSISAFWLLERVLAFKA